MAYRRTKIGNNSYSTTNTKTGVNTVSYSSGSKNLRVTNTTRSDGRSYTTTTINNGGWITRQRVSNSSPKARRGYSRRSTMSFKYTPQLFLLCIILIAFGFVLEKLGF